MIFTQEQRQRIWEILASHTYPQEQLGFFSMDDLINLIEKALSC